MKNKLVYIIGGTIVAGSLMFGGSGYASATSAPAIFGTVTSVDGPNITVTGKTGRNKETTTYTVDASGAQVSAGLGLGSQKLSTAHVAVGDQVAVLGVSGS